MKGAYGLSADDLVRATNFMFTNLGYAKIVTDAGINLMPD